MIKSSMCWSKNRDYITILVFAIWYRKGGLKYVSNNPISICTPRIHTMRCFGHLLCFQYHSVATHEKKNLSSGGRTKTMVLNSYLSSFELPVCLTQLLRESIKSANIVRIKKCTFKEWSVSIMIVCTPWIIIDFSFSCCIVLTFHARWTKNINECFI